MKFAYLVYTFAREERNSNTEPKGIAVKHLSKLFAMSCTSAAMAMTAVAADEDVGDVGQTTGPTGTVTQADGSIVPLSTDRLLFEGDVIEVLPGGTAFVSVYECSSKELAPGTYTVGRELCPAAVTDTKVETAAATEGAGSGAATVGIIGGVAVVAAAAGSGGDSSSSPTSP